MLNNQKQRHPATVRMDRIGKNGLPRPFSVAEQWKQVVDWHAFLDDDQVREYPVLEGMNAAWNTLEPIYDLYGKKTIERGEKLRHVSNSPLSTLFYFIDMGFYPPPELLLALHDCWDTYQAGYGHISLEQAFFGNSRQKSGNYAKRNGARFERMAMRWIFDGLISKGVSRTQAAEAVSAQFGGKLEPESILRIFRSRKFLPLVTPEK